LHRRAQTFTPNPVGEPFAAVRPGTAIKGGGENQNFSDLKSARRLKKTKEKGRDLKEGGKKRWTFTLEKLREEKRKHLLRGLAKFRYRSNRLVRKIAENNKVKEVEMETARKGEAKEESPNPRSGVNGEERTKG